MVVCFVPYPRHIESKKGELCSLSKTSLKLEKVFDLRRSIFAVFPPLGAFVWTRKCGQVDNVSGGFANRQNLGIPPGHAFYPTIGS